MSGAGGGEGVPAVCKTNDSAFSSLQQRRLLLVHKTWTMDYYNDYEDEGLDFDVDGTGYRFEPEYTDTELQEMDEQRARDATAAEQAQPAEVAAEDRPRISGDFLCSCKRCKQMPTEDESLCCREWDMLLPNAMENLDVSLDDTGSSPVCTTESMDFQALINRAVLETFFRVPKINWKRRTWRT